MLLCIMEQKKAKSCSQWSKGGWRRGGEGRGGEGGAGGGAGLKMLETEKEGPSIRSTTGSFMARTRKGRELAVSLTPNGDVTILIISAVIYVA